MGTVTQMQSVLWTKLTAVYENSEKNFDKGRAAWPEIASYMAQLRKDYPSDPEFGAALVLHGIEYNRNDRAALIWMGSLPSTVLAEALARSDKRNPCTFRIEVESWGDAYYKTVLLSHGCETATADPLPAESPENAACTGQSVVVAIPEAAKTATQVEDHNGHQWDSRSKLFPLGDDGRLLQAIIGGNNASGAIYPLMPKQKKFLRFVIDQIKAGRLAPPAFNSAIFHAQHLLPALDRTFVRDMRFAQKGDKPDAQACVLFMDHFDEVVRAAEQGWSYAEFRRVCKGMAARQPPASAAEIWAQRPTAAAIDLNLLPATATMMDGTVLKPEPIYVCGECLYPSEARPDLDYVTAYLYAHHCRELVGELHRHSVAETGMSIAHHGLWLGRHYHAIGGFLSAIGTAIRARGNTMDRALWFKLEEYRNRVRA